MLLWDGRKDWDQTQNDPLIGAEHSYCNPHTEILSKRLQFICGIRPQVRDKLDFHRLLLLQRGRVI